MSKRRKNLVKITAFRTTDNGVKRYGCDSIIPMQSVSASESETCASRIIDALNVQLEVVASKYRIVFEDRETKKIMSVSYAETKQ